MVSIKAKAKAVFVLLFEICTFSFSPYSFLKLNISLFSGFMAFDMVPRDEMAFQRHFQKKDRKFWNNRFQSRAP
jgi:hypothetical protein